MFLTQKKNRVEIRFVSLQIFFRGVLFPPNFEAQRKSRHSAFRHFRKFFITPTARVASSLARALATSEHVLVRGQGKIFFLWKSPLATENLTAMAPWQ